MSGSIYVEFSVVCLFFLLQDTINSALKFLIQIVMDYEEHEKRAWSVDFSYTKPTLLVSGSDDCKVLTLMEVKIASFSTNTRLNHVFGPDSDPVHL